jgi:glycosyltransferase involved in cell wall biosynthesis
MFYPRGGSAHSARALARGLRQQGLSVTLVAGSRGPAEDLGNAHAFYGDVRPVDFDPALASPDPLRFQGPPGTAPIHPSFEDRAGAPDRVFAKLDDLAYERQVQAWARELDRAGARQADALYLHHLTPLNEAATRVAPHVPVIGQLHGTELLMLERIDDGPPPGWRYAEQWARRLRAWAQRCERLIVSPGGLQRAAGILDLPEERFVPISSGVDVELFKPVWVDRHAFWRHALTEEPRGWLPDSAPGSARYTTAEADRVASSVVLLYVGRFTAIKRLDLLIAAFGHAQRRLRKPASLVLLGGHPGEVEGEHPATIAASLGVRDVFLAGWYGHEGLPPFFAASDAVVLASDREQFGLGLIEGMACGLPAIVTRSYGPETIVEDGGSGWLVARGDELQLAHALIEAIEDDRERRRRGRHARADAIARFSSQSVGAATAQTITHAVARTSPRLRTAAAAGEGA